jgi:hypothetical protein
MGVGPLSRLKEIRRRSRERREDEARDGLEQEGGSYAVDKN